MNDPIQLDNLLCKSATLASHPDCCNTFFSDHSGLVIVKITKDGRLEKGPGMSDDAASLLFFDACQKVFGNAADELRDLRAEYVSLKKAKEELLAFANEREVVLAEVRAERDSLLEENVKLNGFADMEMKARCRAEAAEAQLAASKEESERMRREAIYFGHKCEELQTQCAEREIELSRHLESEFAVKLTAERARTKELVEGIKSILPAPPYHSLLEPEWVYLSGLVEGVGDIPEDLFAQVEARKCFFSLYYEREKRSPLMDSGMIWRCGCGAPESYVMEGKTAKEAVEKALARAAELESSDSHKRSRVPL